MSSVDTSGFAEANKREHELNHRQREILDLLVRGKTNGEIAEQLGMTLDGAKWNVSEILTKLGLSTREEAAEYWRWRNGLRLRTASLFRRMASVVPLKWAGAAAAGAAGLAVVVAALWTGLGRGEDAAGTGLYYEASASVRNSASTVGTPIERTEESTSTIRVWQIEPGRARLEVDTTSEFGQESLLVVLDGERQWTYITSSNTYSEAPLPFFPDDVADGFHSFGLSIGPAQARTRDHLLESFAEATGFTPESLGSDVVLGLRCERISIGPAMRSTDGPSGSAEICLHEQSMTILRFSSTDETQSALIEVTKLDLEANPDPDLFRFTPPSGAARAPEASGGSSTTFFTDGDSTAPPGFFAPRDLPTGFERVTVEQSRDAHGILVGHLARYEAGGASFVIAQSLAPERPNAPDGANSISLNDHVGWLLPAENDRLQFTTWRDGVQITITGDGIDELTLLNIAGGLERQ